MEKISKNDPMHRCNICGIFFLIQVKTILVNIFGGIVNCATVATGIIKASKKLHLELPLVVRLEGKQLIYTLLSNFFR